MTTKTSEYLNSFFGFVSYDHDLETNKIAAELMNRLMPAILAILLTDGGEKIIRDNGGDIGSKDFDHFVLSRLWSEDGNCAASWGMTQSNIDTFNAHFMSRDDQMKKRRE